MKTAFFALIALAASPAFATDSIICESGRFEAPAVIVLDGNTASASVNWDGPGAIFNAEYKDLTVFEMAGVFTITQPIVVHPGRDSEPGFNLTFRKGKGKKWHGTLHVDSTDGNNMTFEGKVTCRDGE